MQSHGRKFFITTPIFYVNAKPHIGHIYSVLLADARARFQRLRNREETGTIFSTGTDEHGLKIQQAASGSGHQSVKDFCDQVSGGFRKTFKDFNVECDDFIRTTEERHIQTVQHCWRQLQSRGFLSKKSYQSWYCVQDESFLTEHQIDKDKKISLESGHPVEWGEEENYTFPLNTFKHGIQSWLNSSEVIKPKVFKSNLDMFLKDDLPDLSVSRSSKRLSWGIPVPDDPSQTIYVWLDALVNYLTVAGYPHELSCWPPDCHVIGKDILKFHAIYWPSFLMALDLPLPRQILCHSHWTVNDEKMSKSKGNVVDPNELAEKIASHEGLRYFLLREGVPHSDGNYSEQQLVNYLNNDLANTLGNLVNRITSQSVNVDQAFTNAEKLVIDSVEAEHVARRLEDLVANVSRHYEDFDFYLGINDIMDCLRRTNAFVQAEKPWELKKSGNFQRLSTVCNLSIESLRICGILLQPIVPGLCDKMLSKLKIPSKDRFFTDAHMFNGKYINHAISQDKVVLFKKI